MCIPLRTLLSAVFILTWIGGSALAANSIPVINLIPPLSVAEGSALSYKVTATDADADPITLSASGLKTWMSFSAGTFTATPDYTKSGTYTVKFTAKDGTSQAGASATITVSNVNRAPTFGALTSKTVAEGSTLTSTVTATDPDRDLVTISASGLKTWMTFSGNTLTLKPGYTDSGSYSVTFSASDGKLATTASLSITVTGINQAPVIGTIPPLTSAEGAAFSYSVIVTDADGDPVTLSGSGLKSWMSLSGNTFSASPGYTDTGTYTVTLTASDGLAQSTGSLSLTVANTNRAPELGVLGNWQIGDGKVLSLPVNATDPDGDAVIVTATGLQSWMSFDGKVFRATPKVGTLGNYTASLTASDASQSATQTIGVTVVLGGSSYPSPWTSYMGSVGGGASWASWVRHWLVSSTGMSLVNDPSLASALYDSAAADLGTHDLMLPITGFVKDGPSMSEFLNLIQDGGVTAWQEAVRSEVETMSLLDPSAKRVFYQLGNEITQSTISTNLRNWASSRGIVIPGVAGSFDMELIPYYAEYFLAPTVDMVMQSSTQYFGDPLAAIIVLGSIGNALTTDARAWLDALLNYQVQGIYAPAQQGKHVYELADLISVHYVGPNTVLDEIWNKWKGQGRLRGLWTTEEIGSKAVDAGQGAGRALLTAAEQLNWFYKRSLTPEQSRVAFYDWNRNGPVVGTSPDEAMLTMHDFIADAPLEVFVDGVTLVGEVGALQTYRFNSLLDGGKRMIVVTPDFTEPGLNASVISVQFDKEGWSGGVTASVHQFSPAGHGLITATVSTTATGYDVTLSPAASLQGDGSALLITLQHQ